MKIDGIAVTYLSEWDGLPVKNHLPENLKSRFKTRNQWLEEGYILRDDAKGHEMHPSSMAKRICIYYLDTEVLPCNSESPEQNCLTCARREGRFCAVAGGYVGGKGYCSEWKPR